MGLFSSMKPLPGQRKGIRFIKMDVTTPLVCRLAVYDEHTIPWNSHHVKSPMACTSVYRWYKAKGVTVEEVEHPKVRGLLFLPEGN